ncbi:MAG: hypothetical protein ACREXN_00810 [Polaromonas sp.]
MNRQAVRDMKRAVNAGCRPGAGDSSVALAKECALSLLSRSITFGHGRLAVIRLGMAVRAGAEVPAEHWDFCREAAHASKDLSMQTLFLAAAQQASTRLADPMQVH